MYNYISELPESESPEGNTSSQPIKPEPGMDGELVDIADKRLCPRAVPRAEQEKYDATGFSLPVDGVARGQKCAITATRLRLVNKPFRSDDDMATSLTTNYSSSGQSQISSKQFSALWDAFLKHSNIGHKSVDWHLARPTMEASLTDHLLEASLHSCCFHLRPFAIFKDRISYFRNNLNRLDAASQAIVTILTSLGARASPHSALLGVAGPDIENGNSSLELVLSAGIRRENAWRAILERAVTLCSSLDILQTPTKRNVEILSAMTNALIFSEVRPDRSRFFHRNAIALYQDVERSNLPPEEATRLKTTLGAALYESDSRISAYAAVPFLIRDADLWDAWSGSGVVIPDLRRENLTTALDEILFPGLITRRKLDDALTLAGYYVCAVQRSHSALAAPRRSTRFLTEFEQHWSNIDHVHSSIQKLHRTLMGLDYTPAGSHDAHELQYDLLICVRLDVRIVDILNLSHVFLLGKRRELFGTPESQAVEALLVMSEFRVRKSLKLLAFYAKVFVDSLDKHVLYHLFTQLDVLPWVSLAVQRVGEPGGPISPEFEVSELELNWFVEGLKLACFYTPLASQRLRELEDGRAARNRRYFAAPEPTSLAPAYVPPQAAPPPPPPPSQQQPMYSGYDNMTVASGDYRPPSAQSTGSLGTYGNGAGSSNYYLPPMYGENVSYGGGQMGATPTSYTPPPGEDLRVSPGGLPAFEEHGLWTPAAQW
ncbi:Zn(2)-C6 fungal-type transcription factor [Pseudohyphozyma bogoriensis]|nr:Zn(2)-C6 fungal-type transcription factor [Pseudohyphozyma bogoriensis]